MAAIYLRHPLHGSKVACMEQEAVYDEGTGWVRFDPSVAVAAPAVVPEPVSDEPHPEQEAAAEPAPEPVNVMARRKPGRPRKGA